MRISDLRSGSTAAPPTGVIEVEGVALEAGTVSISRYGEEGGCDGSGSRQAHFIKLFGSPLQTAFMRS